MQTHSKILIVDDQPRARLSLTALLSTWPGVGQVHEAGNGQEAVHGVEQLQPDLVVMDMCMPVMDGLQATRLIKQRWPQVRIVILSMYADRVADALAAGADAFVAKGESPERLLDALGISEKRGGTNG